jgi:hypothetical protein
MMRDGQLVCDSCQTKITRITSTPGDGWEQMHNLCSACFVALWKTSMTLA